MAAGEFFTIEGGMLDCLFTLKGLWFGFLWGQYSPALRFNEMSRKLTKLKFHWMVILRPAVVYICLMSFLLAIF